MLFSFNNWQDYYFQKVYHQMRGHIERKIGKNPFQIISSHEECIYIDPRQQIFHARHGERLLNFLHHVKEIDPMHVSTNQRTDCQYFTWRFHVDNLLCVWLNINLSGFFFQINSAFAFLRELGVFLNDGLDATESSNHLLMVSVALSWGSCSDYFTHLQVNLFILSFLMRQLEQAAVAHKKFNISTIFWITPVICYAFSGLMPFKALVLFFMFTLGKRTFWLFVFDLDARILRILRLGAVYVKAKKRALVHLVMFLIIYYILSIIPCLFPISSQLMKKTMQEISMNRASCLLVQYQQFQREIHQFYFPMLLQQRFSIGKDVHFLYECPWYVLKNGGYYSLFLAINRLFHVFYSDLKRRDYIQIQKQEYRQVITHINGCKNIVCSCKISSKMINKHMN